MKLVEAGPAQWIHAAIDSSLSSTHSRVTDNLWLMTWALLRQFVHCVLAGLSWSWSDDTHSCTSIMVFVTEVRQARKSDGWQLDIIRVLMDVRSKCWVRSAVYKMYRSGLRMEPWWTPNRMGTQPHHFEPSGYYHTPLIQELSKPFQQYAQYLMVNRQDGRAALHFDGIIEVREQPQKNHFHWLALSEARLQPWSVLPDSATCVQLQFSKSLLRGSSIWVFSC